MLLLQVPDLPGPVADAAKNVAAHASGTAFTALLWLLVVLFGAVAGLLGWLLYKRPSPAAEAAGIPAATQSTFAGWLMEAANANSRLAVVETRQEGMLQVLEQIVDLQEDGKQTGLHINTLQFQTASHATAISEIRQELRQLRTAPHGTPAAAL